MRLHTGNRRARRKRPMCPHFVAGRGVYMRLDCGEYGTMLVPLSGREQVGFYRRYK
jgi:hypothetical protein